MTAKNKNTSKQFAIRLSEEQKAAKPLIMAHPVNFLLGKAGSGKTLLACAIALDMLAKKNISKIIITRPTVSSENNGFLPGTLEEKMDPWMYPIFSNLSELYGGPDKINSLKNDNTIELVSLSHFRGRTFKNSVCIIDEFQNLTKQQLQMVLTRLGIGSIMIFTGDVDQIDLKNRNESSFNLLKKLSNSQYINIITLNDNHRHPALDDILRILNE